jgi:hypothetical protein
VEITAVHFLRTSGGLAHTTKSGDSLNDITAIRESVLQITTRETVPFSCMVRLIQEGSNSAAYRANRSGASLRLARAAIAQHMQRITLKPEGRSYIASCVGSARRRGC